MIRCPSCKTELSNPGTLPSGDLMYGCPKCEIGITCQQELGPGEGVLECTINRAPVDRDADTFLKFQEFVVGCIARSLGVPVSIPTLDDDVVVALRQLEADGVLPYELPAGLLAEYHRLLDKKFSRGLTPEEESELVRVGHELDEADMQQPLVQAIMKQADEDHERWMARAGEIIATLRHLRESL